MIPVVTPDEMAAIDEAAPEPVEVLIDRAGAAVARAALDMLGGTYGRRVVVVAGRGNNGADGRSAGARLARRGAKVTVVEAGEAPAVLPPCDLVIDAAYGTGLTRDYEAPAFAGPTPVLAVDIASGVDGTTGRHRGRPLAADRTVTFAALKPGLVLEPGASTCGAVEVADIGLDTSAARTHVVVGADVAQWVPARPVDAHKWRAACLVVAGAAGMTGAGSLCAEAALRAGAGYVLWCSSGAASAVAPVEAVRAERLDDVDLTRFAAAVVGPGLGRDRATTDSVERLCRTFAGPLVIDGDGLSVVSREVLAARSGPTVLTPHDGEFATLSGDRPADDRIGAVRALAEATGSIVLLKGPTTVVSSPEGDVLVSTSGDQRLATAGTGDVLAGVIAAFAARGTALLRAAAAGAYVHGAAATAGPDPLVASDLVHRIAGVAPGVI